MVRNPDTTKRWKIEIQRRSWYVHRPRSRIDCICIYDFASVYLVKSLLLHTDFWYIFKHSFYCYDRLSWNLRFTADSAYMLINVIENLGDDIRQHKFKEISYSSTRYRIKNWQYLPLEEIMQNNHRRQYRKTIQISGIGRVPHISNDATNICLVITF